jgi:hypothetical protein
MDNCCKIDLGSYPHNEDINTGLEAAQAGVHHVKLSYLGSIIPMDLTLSIGQEIVIPNNRLNENYVYDMTIEQPDGTFYMSAECPNFKFKTYVSLNNACDHECDNAY